MSFIWGCMVLSMKVMLGSFFWFCSFAILIFIIGIILSVIDLI